MINRPEYLKQLLSARDKKPIKIIVGVRRCGKSTLLELYKNKLLKLGVLPKQIQHINLEDLEVEYLQQDYRALYEHIKKNLVKNKMNYVFLDEIQVVDGFGKVANSLYLKSNVDLYLTGSNSKMLSSNLANEIERETITLKIFPLSFKEYLSAFTRPSSMSDIELHFSNYLRYSSFPGIFDYKDKENKFDLATISRYLKDIYDKIILHDIVANKSLTDIGRLNSVIRFMADNISRSEMSINKMSKMMSHDGRKIDTHTLEKYIDAFIDSFLVYHINRYDIKGKQQLKTNGKYYLVDMGLRYLLFGNKETDTGHMLENIIYLELCRRVDSNKVWIGKIASKEVDFVVDDLGRRTYYQISETMKDKKTSEREFTSLEMISDHNQKIILTRDIAPESSKNGIQVMNVLNWLLS